jgi:NADPH:quinone reductase-like Zn-dependent oxidoreductase
MSRVVFARFSPVMAMMLPLAGAFTAPAAAVVARSSSSLSSRSLCMQSSTAAPKGKLLVLGGTGFVGARVTELALERGYEVVSISRRGAPAEGLPVTATTKGVSWRSGDAAKPEDVEKIMAEGGFTGVIHAIGCLPPEYSQ